MARRKLSDVERFYIEEHSDVDPKELASIMPGVGVAAVKAYIATLPPLPAPIMVEAQQKLPKPKEGQSEIERQEELQALRAGNFIQTTTMGGNKGIAIMSEAASTIADAKSKPTGNADKNAQRIHRMHP